MNNQNHKWFKVILLALLTVLTVFSAIFVFRGGETDDPLPVDSAKWQAVFLSDGQVYFGRLAGYDKKFVRLTSVYYLKYANDPNQNRFTQSALTPSQSLNLIKLGGEVHGPEDSMFIAKDKILFFENLKDSSTVVQSIKNLNR